MISSAEAGYGQMRRQTAEPRSIEYQLLIQVSAEIEKADPETFEGYKSLCVAIKKNTDLWMAFAADLSSPDNQMPEALKQSLAKLAAFSIAYGAKVLADSAPRDPLININRNVATGLRGEIEEKAA